MDPKRILYLMADLVMSANGNVYDEMPYFEECSKPINFTMSY